MNIFKNFVKFESFSYSMAKVVFLHEPPMKENINLASDQIDLNKLTELLNEVSKEKDFTEVKDKSFFIGIINEDFQVSTERQTVDEKYNKILSDLGGSIPDKTEIQDQNEELNYMSTNIKNNELLKETESLLDKKKSETKKLFNLWTEICKNTPQLKNCANIINLKEIEQVDNDSLANYFNEKLEQIAEQMNNH